MLLQVEAQKSGVDPMAVNSPLRPLSSYRTSDSEPSQLLVWA